MWKHHIIDPRTGLPAGTDVLCATVVAPAVQTAETAAKVILISGSQPGLAWIEARRSLSAMIVFDHGEELHSRGFDDHLWRTA